jgi:hypothetical protein
LINITAALKSSISVSVQLSGLRLPARLATVRGYLSYPCGTFRSNCARKKLRSKEIIKWHKIAVFHSKTATMPTAPMGLHKGTQWIEILPNLKKTSTTVCIFRKTNFLGHFKHQSLLFKRDVL